MNPGLYQRLDGTVFWKHEDGRWTYLSPLFGEWLNVWAQPDNGTLKRYPRNLNVPTDQLQESKPSIESKGCSG